MTIWKSLLLAGSMVATFPNAWSGQAPGALSSPDVPIGYHLASVRYLEQAQFHKGPWPIRNGHNYQPTENELKALHRRDVTPDEAVEIDRLYNQLVAAHPGAAC